MSSNLAIAVFAAALAAMSAGVAMAQEPAGRDSTSQAAGPAAREGDHQSEAVKHIMAAVDAGKSGSAAGVSGHAEEALTHVRVLAKEKRSDELQAAVKSLEDAIAKGKSGDADGATRSAEDALQKVREDT